MSGRCSLSGLSLICQGHLPSYGDWGRDLLQTTTLDKKTAGEIYRSALHFYHFSSDSTIKNEARDCLQRLYPLISDELGTRGVDLFLSHPIKKNSLPFSLPKNATITGQAGIGILRDANETTVLMKTGANTTHSHDDVLAYMYYACGKEVSADMGYGIYGTNGHNGWGTKSIAHNTVVVNSDEGMKKGQKCKPFSGGEFSFLYESDTVNVYEGKAPHLYGIDSFQRMIGIAPIAASSSYVIDFFYIEGARTCDYAFHAFQEDSELELTNVEKVLANHWTLAGIDEQKKLYYDEHEKSFGERLTTGETFSTLLEQEKAQGWTPDKNNGYGFIYDVKEYKSFRDGFTAAWKSVDGYRLTWMGLCDRSDRIFTGMYPSLDGRQKRPMLIVRSDRKNKQFVSVVHTKKRSLSQAEVLRIERLSCRGSQVTALAVYTTTEMTDFWVYSPVAQKMSIRTSFGEWSVEGRCGWIRTDNKGKIIASACVQASSMQFQGKQMKGKKNTWFEITGMNEEENSLALTWDREVDELLDEELHEKLDGRWPCNKIHYVRIAPLPHAQSVVYQVQEMEKRENKLKMILRDSFTLSKGIVESCKKNRLSSLYPLPLAASFAGKKIIGDKGGRGTITKCLSLKEIEIKIQHSFEKGETFKIIDIEPGYYLQWL
nr:heparinase II/III family protein [Aneurinibacillus terranovensis]